MQHLIPLPARLAERRVGRVDVLLQEEAGGLLAHVDLPVLLLSLDVREHLGD